MALSAQKVLGIHSKARPRALSMLLAISVILNRCVWYLKCVRMLLAAHSKLLRRGGVIRTAESWSEIKWTMCDNKRREKISCDQGEITELASSSFWRSLLSVKERGWKPWNRGLVNSLDSGAASYLSALKSTVSPSQSSELSHPSSPLKLQ